jgi:hypothetical protein
MSMKKTSLFACLLLFAGACKMNSVQEDRPARVVNPSPESRAELERAVSDMLFGADVILADEALTDSSVLLIERRRIRDSNNVPLSGRDLGEPEHFKLVMSGTRCVLIHERDDARYELQHTQCAAESAP